MLDCIYTGKISAEQVEENRYNLVVFEDNNKEKVFMIRFKTKEEKQKFENDKDSKAEYYDKLEDIPEKFKTNGKLKHCIAGGFKEEVEEKEPEKIDIKK